MTRATRNLRQRVPTMARCATVLASPPAEVLPGTVACAMVAYATVDGPVHPTAYARAARRVSWALTQRDAYDPWSERLARCAMVADKAVAVFLDWAPRGARGGVR